MYETILHPTDGSEGSEAAAAHAIELAEQYDATLHVLYVVDTSVLTLDDHSTILLDSLEEAGEEAVEALVERAEAAGVSVVGAVESGTPYRTIVEYAREHGADLVVVGTHGRTGIDRVLLGSVSERVVRTAGIPVLVIPSGKEEAEAAENAA